MSSVAEHFDACFERLTGHAPFPWQRALFGEFQQERFPGTCDIPTGLGKTSIIAIWLLALADRVRGGTAGHFPRRLVYVVNRRTVVDQATREVEQVRERLVADPRLKDVADAVGSLGARHSDSPLAISTLRGQFADNAEWRDDPSRAAAVIGTVDMIGSRLVFSGYGCGFKSRPLHAGFLGQDVLLVHDEAHLEPAFQQFVSAIESEQERCRAAQPLADSRGFRVMALTATARSGGETFGLTAADHKHSEVAKRIGAPKGVAFWPIDDEKQTWDKVRERALDYKDSDQAILVFLRRLEDVRKVAERLQKTKPVQTLTGTLRGLERDALARSDDVFARFMPKSEVAPKQGTVYLVCTSAGEVGVNISARHLVCDLTPFDSMAQRFGRVNRFGEGDARIDVVHCRPSKESEFHLRCERTLALLKRLPKGGKEQRHDASPGALAGLPIEDRRASFTPEPVILPTSDILFDAWALTSVRSKLPGRPAVADWLHGLSPWEPPETHVAWREEVERLAPALQVRYKADDLLEDYPLKPHELLRDRTDRVFKELERLANLADGSDAAPVWVVDDMGLVTTTTLGKLAEAGKDALNGQTVLLPPKVGGLRFGHDGRSTGLLDGSVPFAKSQEGSYDVADEWRDQNDTLRRCRGWDGDPRPKGMRLVRSIDTWAGSEDEGEQPSRRRYWYWYVRPRSADDDGSRTARVKQELEPHLQSAEGFANAIAAKLGLNGPEATAVTRAAGWHDRGKNREVWQRSIGNREYPQLVLAKSGGKMRPTDLNDYRHEFGSLIDVSSVPEFLELEPEVQDLVLHLIAAHHGRARPHFPADEAFDECAEEVFAAIAGEVPRRFARLQRKYGRWGLAYLESLVRAADALASQPGESEGSEPPDAIATSPHGPAR